MFNALIPTPNLMRGRDLFIMNKTENKPANPIVKLEEEVLTFWDWAKIFEKSVEREAPKGDYVFYDGPPFATGLPHHGHIVASLMKDAVPRYWTMNGFRVERKWGWDCHGLPIENIAEKELGFKRKKDILEYGVDKFNEFCRSKVLSYVEEWKKVIRRLGRWADMENSYKTMDLPFMESVWWVFKQLWDKGLIYESYRSIHICPRCETTLSQQEVTEGYKEGIKDLSAVVKFELEGSPSAGSGQARTYVLAWTTTPWTLIANTALAVGEDIDYLKLDVEFRESNIKESYIVSKDRIGSVINVIGTDVDDDTIDALKDVTAEFFQIEHNNFVKTSKVIKGKDLIGKKYKPLFDYYSKDESLKNKEKGWMIYAGDFVSTEDGTGIVHIAPAFGEDDLNLGKKENLPFVQHLGMDGVINNEVTDFAGLHVKPIEDVQATDKKIVEYLKENNKLFSSEQYEHNYPHCWRCETPLLNYVTTSWFVNVLKVKERAIELAKEISWSPAHIKEGRWGKWLEGARDWSISRQRFWASVMPIWKCEACGEYKVVGSVDEIREQFGNPNKLFLFRHGEAENNVKKILSCLPEKTQYGLTERGRAAVLQSAKGLKDQKVDLIISSPLTRTKETAELIAKELGVEIIFDDRLRETDSGKFNGQHSENWRQIEQMQFNESNQFGVETYSKVRVRINSLLEDLNCKYENKNLVIVSHGDPLRTIEAILNGWSDKEMAARKYPDKGMVFPVYSKAIDLHKHRVDSIVLSCDKCRGIMKRVPDVLDTWFDSGSMPYAQMHYPFENKEKFEQNFPAEFIAEGTDQTRAWFYYLHLLASAIKDKPAFKNVIVNGIVLAEDGKKMAKRLKNYTDPSILFERYGADAVRYYLLSSAVMMADDLNFSDKGVEEALRKNLMVLWNVYKFYEQYAVNYELSITNYQFNSINVLDQWIIARLNQLIAEVTKQMDGYDLPRSVRPLSDFINDLSTWYIRRSRERFKSDDEKDPSASSGQASDRDNALATTKYVLIELSKVMAPFMPFMAESLWQRVTGNNFKDDKKSVHLEAWPESRNVERVTHNKILEEMSIARTSAAEGLSARDAAGIKIRQVLPFYESPLAKDLSEELARLIKEEVNVLRYAYGSEKKLGTELTEELKLDGVRRELVRSINNLRKNAGLTIADCIAIYWSIDEADFSAPLVKQVFEKFGEELKKDTLAESIKHEHRDDADAKKEVKVNGETVWLGIKKI